MTATSTTDPWIARRKPNPQARLRLFCFPYAGGGASIYHTWSSDVPQQVEICPVQLPGRENRLMEPPFTQIAPLVQALVPALRPYMDMPFAFFGHSLGAIVSFELARSLRNQYRLGPVHMFVSGCSAPQIPDTDPPIHELPDAEFVEEVRRLNGTPDAVLEHPELLQLLLPVLRADFGMRSTYTYTPAEPFAFPISAFGGIEDSDVSQEDVEAWRQHTRSAFTLRMLPGDHFFLHSARDQLVQLVSEDLMRILNRLNAGWHL